jgi:hypothetical protein
MRVLPLANLIKRTKRATSGASQTFSGPAGNIWNNSAEDDGALYNPNGQLVSYFNS